MLNMDMDMGIYMDMDMDMDVDMDMGPVSTASQGQASVLRAEAAGSSLSQAYGRGPCLASLLRLYCRPSQ